MLPLEFVNPDRDAIGNANIAANGALSTVTVERELTAAEKVFGITELLENVLLTLRLPRSVLTAQGTSQAFRNCIKNSQKIQKRLQVGIVSLPRAFNPQVNPSARVRVELNTLLFDGNCAGITLVDPRRPGSGHRYWRIRMQLVPKLLWYSSTASNEHLTSPSFMSLRIQLTSINGVHETIEERPTGVRLVTVLRSHHVLQESGKVDDETPVEVILCFDRSVDLWYYGRQLYNKAIEEKH